MFFDNSLDDSKYMGALYGLGVSRGLSVNAPPFQAGLSDSLSASEDISR